MFASFAPLLHTFYDETLSILCKSDKTLQRNFARGVFAACTFNFGPCTVTLPHIDSGNLAWGWCAITALGRFNPDLGGHLVLWELGLVIRFPPGSTILIPSALVRHSNTALQDGETRYSFTQYSAGGIFRWVSNGLQSDKSFLKNASQEELKQRDEARRLRWKQGLNMLSRLDDI